MSVYVPFMTSILNLGRVDCYLSFEKVNSVHIFQPFLISSQRPSTDRWKNKVERNEKWNRGFHRGVVHRSREKGKNGDLCPDKNKYGRTERGGPDSTGLVRSRRKMGDKVGTTRGRLINLIQSSISNLHWIFYTLEGKRKKSIVLWSEDSINNKDSVP